MSWPPEEGSTKEAPAFPASPGCPPRDDHWKSERVPTEREQKTCQLTSQEAPVQELSGTASPPPPPPGC